MTYEQTELINLIPEPKTLTLAWEEINVYKKKSANIFKKCLPGNDLKQTNDQIINNGIVFLFLLKLIQWGNNKLIVSNIVNGIAKPYEMLAILGASGSGKTTLLNTLNMRNIGSLQVEGSVKVNGQNIFSIEQISSISGYVQQNDLFIGTLKVKEHLIFQVFLEKFFFLIQFESSINLFLPKFGFFQINFLIWSWISLEPIRSKFFSLVYIINVQNTY